MRTNTRGDLVIIDIHSHLIYGLDDGAKTLKETIAMINMAYSDGVRAIIATPHYRHILGNDLEKTARRFELICDFIAENRPEMKLYLGNECYLDENLLTALLEGKCRTLADSPYVLIEINYYAPLQITRMMLSDIVMKGYIPIIAHCERLMDTKNDLLKLSELKELGCLFQVNARTILEPQRGWLENWINMSLKTKSICFIASDAHDVVHRPPLLGTAYSVVRNNLGNKIADDVFCSNALGIINPAT